MAGGTRKRRVLIIVENLSVPLDRRVWSEATTLVQAGYEVSVICPVGGESTALYEELEGVRIYRHTLPLEARGVLGYLQEYASALFHEFRLSFKVGKDVGFDVIHACNPPDLIWLVGLFHKVFGGKKFIFDHHDLNPELYEAKFGRRDLFWGLLRLSERATFAAADISIATNESYKKIAVERGKMKPEDVFVVRSGPNINKVRLVEPDPKWRNGRQYLVGYVGVVGAQEGLDLMLESLEYMISKGRTDVQFVVVGGGPELNAIKAQALDMKLQDYVTFTGRVDDATLLSALSTADVCINPDRPNVMNDKSTMNKIMEYMALQKPIVQYDLAEGRVSALDASLYAKCTDPQDFADKILELLADPERRKAMGEFGRKRVVSDLSWDTERPKLLAAYETVFSR